MVRWLASRNAGLVSIFVGRILPDVAPRELPSVVHNALYLHGT